MLIVENNEEDKKKYKFTGPLRPGKISQRLFVPEHIAKPDWYYSGVPEEEMKSKLQQLVDIKGPEDVVKMRECAAIGRFKVLYYQPEEHWMKDIDLLSQE